MFVSVYIGRRNNIMVFVWERRKFIETSGEYSNMIRALDSWFRGK